MTAAAAAAAAASLDLSHVRYFIDASVPHDLKLKLEDLLEASSAAPCRLLDTDQEPSTSSSAGFDVGHVTHIVTLSPTYPGYRAVEERNAKATGIAEAAGRQAGTAPRQAGQPGELIAVVTPRWLTRSYDLRKRQEEQFYSPDPRQLFSGVVVCTEDLPQGDSETIKGIVAALGGQWRQALVVEVTHLVCIKTSGRKFERLMVSGYKIGMKAILPHWFDDCIKLQQRLPENDYLWPEPPCLASKIQKSKPYITRLQAFLELEEPPRLGGMTHHLLDSHADQRRTEGYLSSLAQKPKAGSDKDTPRHRVLEGKRIYVADSCELGKDGLGVYKSGIFQAGGVLVAGKTRKEQLRALEAADYVIVNVREGWEFWKAYEAQKTIANLDWLIYVLFTASKPDVSVLPSPMNRLLHYPWPKASIPDFEKNIVTVSGYAGSAREAIKRMIELLGGRFEGTMTKNKTTHVISSALSGSKVQHAQLWNVPVSNHFWIEDCFLSWSIRSTSVSQYHNFDLGPKDFTFASLVGTRPISPQVVETWTKRTEVQRERQKSLKELANELNLDDVDERVTQRGVSREGSPLAPDARSQRMVVQESVVLPEPAKTNGRTPSPPRVAEMPPMDDGDVTMEGEPETETLQTDDTPPPPVRDAPTSNSRKLPKRKSPEPSTSAASATPEPALQPSKPILEPPSSASTTIEVATSRSAPPAKKQKKRISEIQRLDQESDTSFGSTPQGYSRRKAAAAATQKLHDTVMPDVLLYQEELKGKGQKRLDDMFGSPNVEAKARLNPSSASSTTRRGRRAGSAFSSNGSGDESAGASDAAGPSGTARPAGTKARKTQAGMYERHVRIDEPKGRLAALKQENHMGGQISSDYSSFDAPPGKKHHPVLPKSRVLEAGGTIRIASTGVDIDEGMRKALARMKAQLLASDLTGCTHMIVKNISRTVKFLQGVSLGVYFVTERWAIDSINQAQFLAEDRYLLQDSDGEQKHSMNLARSIKKARSRKLFDEQIFYMSPGVQPSFDTLKLIAEAAGGKVIKKVPTVKIMQDQADAHVIASPDEVGQWVNLFKNGIPVFTGEAIIKSALQQEMRFGSEYMLDPDAE